MNLQQLRFICAVVRQNFNASAAADSLYTSQPGVSKQIQLLEEEINVALFVRRGKRIIGMTPAGEQIFTFAQRVVGDIENIRKVGQEFSQGDRGEFVIATTHTQARYSLPMAIKTFTERYPGVQLRLRQGNPTQVAEMLAAGEADVAVATESLNSYAGLVALPCYQWNRVVITPTGHPLLQSQPLTLEAVAAHPIVTYDQAFAGRSLIDKTFANHGLSPNIVLSAIDSDVIKAYVELGLGIGIVAQMAYDPVRDTKLEVIDASHLFDPSTTYLALRQGTYLRGYLYTFIALYAPHLDRNTVDQALDSTVASRALLPLPSGS